MWQRVINNYGGRGSASSRLVRRLLWLLPAFVVLLSGAKVVTPAFAATPLTVIVVASTQNAQVGVPVSFFGSIQNAQAGCTPMYTFIFSDGVNTGTGTSPTVTHTFTQPGTPTVTLSVTDSCGNSGTSQPLAVTVTGQGTGGSTGTCTPTAGGIIAASINPASQSAATGASLSFTGLASGAVGTPTYSFSFGDGSTATGASVTHAFTTAGTFTVTLTVTDQNGKVGCAVSNVTVSASGSGSSTGSNPNIRVAPNGPYVGTPGQAVSFGGFAQTINQGATITGYQWNFGDNTATGSGQFVSHTYAAAGTYTVTLTATDSSGQSSSATTTATIGGGTSGGGSGSNTTGTTTTNGVTANTGGPYTGAGGTTTTFNATATTANANASIVSCVLSFGDNSTSAPCLGATHVYNTNGTYTVVVTATDSTGAVAVATTTVTVNGSNRTVSLVAGCSNVSSTFADGTPTGTVASAISPQATVLSIWKLADPSTARYRGYFPGATQASDLPTLNRLDAIFICVNAAATLSEPSV